MTMRMMMWKRFLQQWPVFKFNSEHFLLFYVGRNRLVTYYDPVWSVVVHYDPCTRHPSV